MNTNVITKLLNAVFIILQVALIIVFILEKDYMNSITLLTVLVLYLIFVFYEYRNGITITNFIRISVAVSIMAHSFLGEYIGLYTKLFYFDSLLHVFGTFSFTVLIFSILEKQGFFQGASRFLVFTFVLLLGSFLGMVFEIGEFIIDVIFKTSNQLSIADNNIDMICDILGSAAAGVFALRLKRKTAA